MTYAYKTIDSPVGKLKLVASEKGLAAILWQDDNPRRVRLSPLVEDAANPFLVEAERQLSAYFAGKLKAFTVPLDFKGTEFQKRRVGGAAHHPVRRDSQLRRNRAPDRRADRVPRGRGGKRQKPDLDHRTVPSRHRVKR